MTTVTPDWTISSAASVPVSVSVSVSVSVNYPDGSALLCSFLHLLVGYPVAASTYTCILFLPRFFWLANWSQVSLELRFFHLLCNRACNPETLCLPYTKMALNEEVACIQWNCGKSLPIFFWFISIFGLAWLDSSLFFAVAVAGGATNVAKPKYQLGVAGAALAAGNLNLQHYKFR